MTRRILISANRVAVSRPGYDVVNPPAISNDYLAVDSSFPAALRLATSGFIYGTPLTSFPTMYFGTPFARAPWIYIRPCSGNVLYDLYQVWVGGNPDTYSSPYTMQIFADRWRIGPALSTADINTVPFNWYYAVFAP
jgi:hypothetical protein